MSEMCLDLSFLEMPAHAEPLWCHMTKEQQNDKIKHHPGIMKKSIKIQNIDIVLCQNLNNYDSSFGLGIFLGHFDL